jgi:hypothetical protein
MQSLWEFIERITTPIARFRYLLRKQIQRILQKGQNFMKGYKSNGQSGAVGGGWVAKGLCDVTFRIGTNVYSAPSEANRS